MPLPPLHPNDPEVCPVCDTRSCITRRHRRRFRAHQEKLAATEAARPPIEMPEPEDGRAKVFSGTSPVVGR